MGRVLAVVFKELDEVRHSRLILSTLIVPTLLYVALPLWLLNGGFASSALGELGDVGVREIGGLQRSMTYLQGLSAAEAIQVLIVDQVLILFMLAPLFIPLTIASYSIIGEKQVRTLEPLLATPIATSELLLAKALSAIVPGVLMTWFSYTVFLFGARASVSERVFSFILGPTWIVAFALVTPLFALLAVNIAVIASSRANDPRAAQQLGAVVILPITAILLAQVTGVVRLDWIAMLSVAVVTAIVDAGLLWLAVRLFNRETILTRWR
ncbi:MAG: ABC transporter permease subunit [Chloroflexi bacterium]|nr:ABC transporter permease subunit [Chloroflexota bacterium]